jgi:hypothetical protein
MTISYQEKSIWGTLVATLVIYGRYFAMGGRGSLALTIVLLAIVQIVYQIILATGSERAPKDERDHLIESKSYRNGYLLLIVGLILCMNVPSGRSVNAMLMAIIGAEIVKSATQLYYYRHGV